MRGKECPHCEQDTFHNEGSHRECSSCGYVGWAWHQTVTGMGRGAGKNCPWCEANTLHTILTLGDSRVVRRCSTCSYTAIEPPE